MPGTNSFCANWTDDACMGIKLLAGCNIGGQLSLFFITPFKGFACAPIYLSLYPTAISFFANVRYIN